MTSQQRLIDATKMNPNNWVVINGTKEIWIKFQRRVCAEQGEDETDASMKRERITLNITQTVNSKFFSAGVLHPN